MSYRSRGTWIILSVLSFQLFAQDNLSFNQIWEDQLFPNNPYNIVFDQNDKPYFYLSNDNAGIKIYKNIGETDFQLLAEMNNDLWEGLKVMHIEQNQQVLYLALGSFFDSNQTSFGIASVDISNPENPKYLDHWSQDNSNSGSASLYLKDNMALLCAMNNGTYIFDTTDPNDLKLTSHFVADPDFPVANPNSVMEPNARGLAIKDNLVFLCNDAGGLRVIDISNVSQPIEISKYINEDFLGVTQQAYNNIIITKNIAIVATDFCGLEFIDISEPSNLKQIAVWNPWDCDGPNNLWINSEGHTNQMKFLPGTNEEVLLVNASDTELVALDIGNLQDLKVVAKIGEVLDNKRTWGMGINKDYLALAYFSSLFPHFADEAKVKVYTWKMLSDLLLPTKSALNVFPNPNSNGIINLRGLESIDLLDYSLYTLTGQSIPIKLINRQDGLCSFRVPNNTPQGIYILNVNGQTFALSEKIELIR